MFYTCPLQHKIEYSFWKGSADSIMEMGNKSADKDIIGYFPDRLKNSLKNVISDMTEIRLRREQPLVLMKDSEMYFLNIDGVSGRQLDNSCVKISSDEMDSIFYAFCRNSVHSFQEELCNGFITLEGGHRVGICGTAVYNNGKISNIKNISSMNLRLSREIIGAGENIYNRVFSSGLKNLLVAGEPSSGKTTVLRDLCRLLGNKHKLSVIDERSEIAACFEGVTQNDVGLNTDVFDGYPKAKGLETAVRVMSPEIIVFDEVSSSEEFDFIRYAMTCGVKICASVHSSSIDDVKMKLPFWKDFDYIAFLSRKGDKACRIFGTDEL